MEMLVVNMTFDDASPVPAPPAAPAPVPASPAAPVSGVLVRDCTAPAVGVCVSPAPSQNSTPSSTFRGYMGRHFQTHPRGIWFAAAKAGDTEALADLRPLQRNVDTRGNYGRTALYLAVEAGQAAAVSLLLDEGADPNFHDRGLDNDTPLHTAAYRGFASVVQLLLAHGADIDAKNSNGRTAEDLAAREGGGWSHNKEECLAVLRSWKTAPTGVPICVRVGVDAEAGMDIWHFESSGAACLRRRGGHHVV